MSKKSFVHEHIILILVIIMATFIVSWTVVLIVPPPVHEQVCGPVGHVHVHHGYWYAVIDGHVYRITPGSSETEARITALLIDKSERGESACVDVRDGQIIRVVS